MTMHDVGSVASAEGEIRLYERSGWPGLSTQVLESKNQMSYSAASAVAAAYGGDLSLVPRYIGFLYGPSGPVVPDPGRDRGMEWSGIRKLAGDIGGNVQVSEFSVPPFLSVVAPAGVDPSSYGHGGNSVTFQACTRSGDSTKCAFSSAGGGFAGPLSDGHLMYQAYLLGLLPGQECRDEKEYAVLARASLGRPSGSGGLSYRAKPEGYELVLSWRVSFY